MDLRKILFLACAGLLPVPLALGADNPVYRPESGLLLIPSIDVVSQQGGYHDAVVEFVQGDLWRLKQVSRGEEIRGVEQVRVIKTSAVPVQVFLEVTGWLGACGGRMDISQRRVDKLFEVSVQWVDPPDPPLFVCPAFVSQFSWIVPLSVYGLQAGEYRYRVNGGVRHGDVMPVSPDNSGGNGEVADALSGSFVLEVDNKLKRDAPDYPSYIPPPTMEVGKGQ